MPASLANCLATHADRPPGVDPGTVDEAIGQALGGAIFLGA